MNETEREHLKRGYRDSWHWTCSIHQDDRVCVWVWVCRPSICWKQKQCERLWACVCVFALSSRLLSAAEVGALDLLKCHSHWALYLHHANDQSPHLYSTHTHVCFTTGHCIHFHWFYIRL